MKVGFIGLGRMGQGMARNLVKAGADLVGYDIAPEAMRAVVEVGATAAGSVAELVRQSDVIFTSLPGPVQVEEVVLGASGVWENLSPGKTLFDLSTSSPTLARRIDGAFREKGAHMLDAPVSGGPAGAASGELVVWVGGDKEIFDRNLPLLSMFSKTPYYTGAIGAGTITKLAHNILGYVIILAEAEVFSLAVKAGLDPLDLWQALRLGVVGKKSPLDMLTNQFLPGRYETPAFALKLGHKDATLATALGKELGVPMRLANMTLEEMTEALGRGYGEWDSRAFLQLQLQRAGVAIAVDPEHLQAAIKALQA